MQLTHDATVPDKTFLNVPFVADPDTVTTPYAFFSIPFGVPYHAVDLINCAGGAEAVRAESFVRPYALNWDHYDFDFGDVLFPDGKPTVSDLGAVPVDIRNPDSVWDTGIAFVKKVVGRGSVPLVVGGFDSIPPIVGGGLDNETVNVLHVDSHLDFREERYGITRGYSSPIRRLRELPWVQDIVQVGMRGIGSARVGEVEDARAAGNRVVTAWELHDNGARWLLDSLDSPGRWLITVDCDGMDPSTAPGVSAREPGGLTFHEMRTLIAGLARRNKVAALVFTEYQPALDIQNITAQTILRLMMNVIGNQRRPQLEIPFAVNTDRADDNVARV
jgi:agmatinase